MRIKEKERHKTISYILKEAIKVGNYIEKLNEKRKKKIEYVLSGETTVNLLGCSTLIFDRVMIDISNSKSDKRVGEALEKKMKKDGFTEVTVDKVQKKETILKNTLLLSGFNGKIRIPSYEKLLVNLDTYGLLLDEEYRVFKKLSEKINIDKLNKIVKHNRKSNLHISNYAKIVLSQNVKSKNRIKTDSEKKLTKKVLKVLGLNKNIILYGGEAINNQTSSESRVTFDVDVLVHSKEIKKITTTLKQNDLKIKDKYSESDSNFETTKTPNGINKTTIFVLNEENKEVGINKKTLVVDFIHKDKIIKDLLKEPIKSKVENPIKMLSLEALICVKLDTIYRSIKKNQNKG